MSPTGTDQPWLLVSDVDDTFVGDDAPMIDLVARIHATPSLFLALNSSRPIPSLRTTLETVAARACAIRPDAVIGGMGTEVDIHGEAASAWRDRFRDFDRAVIDAVLAEFGFPPHNPEYQTPYKASFAVPVDAKDAVIAAIEARGVPARIIHSGVSDMDILPANAGKQPAMHFVAEALGVPDEHIIVAGDSGNDIDMFAAAPHGIVVGNAREELKRAVDPETAYFANAARAAGIAEGLTHYGVIDP